jgi:hypothetical protein
MLLVLVAVAMCTIMALSFLAAQEPTAAVASNIDRKTQARAIAESALKMAIDYVKEDSNWRTDKASGQWMAGVALDGGTFDLFGVDEDGDFADDESEEFTLTAVATYQGVTHQVSARMVVQNEPPIELDVCFVVRNDNGLTSEEQNKRDLFESWGYTVTLLDDGASTSEFEAAVALSECVFISSEASYGSVGSKLRTHSIGVVYELAQMSYYFDIATSGTMPWGTTIEIIDNSHYVTAPFDVGQLQVATSNIRLHANQTNVASGANRLGEHIGTNNYAVLTVEAGADLLNSNTAPGRRVKLPWTGSTAQLNSNGRLLTRRALEWASAGDRSGLSVKWHDLSSSPSDLDDVDWEADATTTTVEPDINWSSTGSTWMSGFPADDFAVELNGSITVPTSGSWTFYLNSDDGSELVIDGTQLIDNDGLHGMREYSGSKSMTADEAVPIRVRFFERGGGAGLILSWSGPGVSKQVVPSSAFSYGDEVTGETPQLIALYEFDQVEVAPTLAGRWALDETGGGAGGTLLLNDRLRMYDGSVIDGYDSASGAYGGANQQLTSRVMTNSTSSNDIDLNSSSTIYGNVSVGAGGNPSSVIDLSGGSTVSGTTGAQSSNTSITNYGAPSGSFGTYLGSANYNGSGDSETWSSNKNFHDLRIRNDATITISGDVEVHVSGYFQMDGGHIVLQPGATLIIWVDEYADILDHSTLNNDTSRPGDVQLIQYGTTWCEIDRDSIVVGSLYFGNDLHIEDGAHVYGSLTVADDLEIDDAFLHLDLSTSSVDAAASGPTIAADSSTLANDGTVTGSPTGGVAGQHGTAFHFDGNDDYVEIPHDDSYLMQAGTFSVWFKTDTTSGQRGLFSKDSSGYDTGGHFSVWLNGSRVEVRMQSTTASNFVQSASGSISTGQWYHIMFAWGEEGMALYLNGLLVDTNSYTGGMGTSSGGVGNYEPIVLGANAWKTADLGSSGLEGFFDGVLDDFRLYNERLSESQALEIYNGATEPTPFLSEAIVEDTSGYGIALDLAVQDTDRVTWSSGSLTFDSDTLAVSLAEATKIHDAIEANGQFAVEVLLERASPGTTASPSRIVEMSEGSSDANFVLGQYGAGYEARVRDSSTGTSGSLSPEFISSTDLNASGDTHVVLSYKDGEVSVYLDGQLDETNTAGGVLNNWEDDLFLVLGGSYGGSHYWRGTLKRVAIYDRAFNASQASNVYNGGDPGDGSSSGVTTKTIWDEQD